MTNVITWGTAESGGGELLTLAHAKDYLRLTGTDEDTLLGELIEEAEAFAQGYMGRTFASTEQTFRVSVPDNSQGFMIPNAPLDPDEDVTVVYHGTDDTDSDVSTSFTVKFGTGMAYAGGFIPAGEYIVTATGGMANRTTWASDQVRLRGALRDLVAEWFANRDPGASSVTDGDLSRVTGADRGIPPRVLAVLDSYKGL